MNEIKVYGIQIINKIFGTSKFCKIYHETEKAILIGQINDEGFLYNDHWVPKKFISIEKEYYGIQNKQLVTIYNTKKDYIMGLNHEY